MSKILIISTTDFGGGAAKAAYNLYRSLFKTGHDVQMLVLNKLSTDSRIKPVNVKHNSFFKRVNHWFNREISNNRTNLSNTIFDFLPECNYEIPKEFISQFDIINIHWCSQFLSRKLLFSFSHAQVFWTLHDMHGFTGGCHYSAGCLAFTNNCSNCPQITDNGFLPELVEIELKIKKEIVQFFNHKVILASSHMNRLASVSAIFKNQEKIIIPYYIDQNIFFRRKREEIRKNLNIEETQILVGLIADNIFEKRKGFSGLFDALKENSEFLINLNVVFYIVGNLSGKTLDFGFPFINKERIESQEDLSDYYNSLDLIIVPSLEDNLPFTGLESLACGVPVIAFNDWGLKDFIQNGKNGFLIPNFDYRNLIEKIKDFSQISLEIRQEFSKSISQEWRKLNPEDCEAKKYFDYFFENQVKREVSSRESLRFIWKIKFLVFQRFVLFFLFVSIRKIKIFFFSIRE